MLRWTKKTGTVTKEEEGLWAYRLDHREPSGVYKHAGGRWDAECEYAGPLTIAEPRHYCRTIDARWTVHEDDSGWFGLFKEGVSQQWALPYCPLCGAESQAHKRQREGGGK